MKTVMLDLVVKRILKETEDVVRVELARQDGEPLPVYQAGAHITLQLPSGLLRQYSLCRLPTTGKSYEIAVLREPKSRGGSAELHRLKEGDTLQCKFPQNHFLLTNPRSTALLIAAGIGVTPLIPMAQTLHKTGTSFCLHYSAKSPAKAPFYQMLKDSPFADKVQFHFTDTERRADIRVLLEQHRDKRDIYVCGPQAFIDKVLEQAAELDWPESKLHREYFSGTRSADMDNAPVDAFQVKVASTGEVIDVDLGVTITEALEANGIDVPVSCEEGWCGTCMTGLLDGVADHRDTFLSNDERASGQLIMPCCSRARSECLVLDL